MKNHTSIIILLAAVGSAFAYDEYSAACMRPGGRTAKAWPEPPCDFKNQGWCTAPGSAYPWHAVRRFVHENQGLMRRMYGDMRQISVLRAEYESNDVLYPGDGVDFQLIRDGVTKRYRPPTETASPRPATTSSKRPVRSTTTTTTLRTTSTSSARPTTTTTSTTTAATPASSTTTEAEVTEVTDTTEVSTTLTTADTTPSYEERQEEVTTEEEEEEEEEELEDQLAEESEYEEEQIEPAEVKNKQQPQLLKRGINACPVKEEVVAPFWANNTRGEVLALLNLYPFEQYVHWEKCTDENQQMFCRDGCRCEQQYRLHRLLAYDPRNECRGIFSDWFKFPSCCVCKCYDIPAEFRLTSRSPRRGIGKIKKVGTKTKSQLAKEAAARAEADALAEASAQAEAAAQIEAAARIIAAAQSEAAARAEVAAHVASETAAHVVSEAIAVPINGLEEHEGEIRADLQAVVHHADPATYYRFSGARKLPETVTIGPIDAATPHFYYQPPLSPLSRRPRREV